MIIAERWHWAGTVRRGLTALALLLLLGAAGHGRAEETAEVYVDISAGSEFTCGLLAGGAVRCWGDDTFGQLGTGNANRTHPVQMPSQSHSVHVGGRAVQIAAGEDHVCALLSTGGLRCWGDATFGQIGSGNTATIGDDEEPATVGEVRVGGKVASVVAGRFHTCALLVGGAVRCWGDGLYGQLGHSGTSRIGDDEAPSDAAEVRVGGRVRHLAAGANHTCALLESGAVRCWGLGADGRLGYGNTRSIGDDEHPETAGDVRLNGQVMQLAAGKAHTCALMESGAVRCWGRGFSGQLGYADTRSIGDDEHPGTAGDVRLGATAFRIAAGKNHTCALLTGGALRCWGSGFHGQLGYGGTRSVGDNEHPAERAAVVLSEPLVRIDGGGAHTCGLLASGRVRCWGLLWAGWPQAGGVHLPGDNEAMVSSGAADIPVRERFPTETELIFHSPTGL